MDNQASEETTIIVGVVHPSGSSGVAHKGGPWFFQFSFYAWRDADGIVHRNKLAVRGEMARESIRNHMDRTKAYSIVKVRITMREDDTAEFIELLDDTVETNDELTQIAAELQKPLTYEHERFGTFVFDRSISQWKVSVDWLGKPVRLMLAGDEAGPALGSLQTTIQLWDHQAHWSQRISHYAVQELLQLKNDVWLENDESPLTPDEFKARMSLESISVRGDGRFEFWHDDGDLFWGHAIWVKGDLQNGPTRADIPG